MIKIKKKKKDWENKDIKGVEYEDENEDIDEVSVSRYAMRHN